MSSRLRIAAMLGALIFVSSSALASAKPLVALALSGVYVQKNDDGTQRIVPIEKERARPGDVIRWDILAKSTGDQPARGFSPVGRIPAGTSFVAGSSSPGGARVEYSLDNGKSWSASPTVTVQTPTGPVVRKADPARYTTLRWTGATLPPGTSAHYVYEVTVR